MSLLHVPGLKAERDYAARRDAAAQIAEHAAGIDEWLEWIHRRDDQPLPSAIGLRDCAAALTAEIWRLREKAGEAAFLVVDGVEVAP